MTIEVPERSLVLLIGPSGAGKSTFAEQHFAETEVISSDRCRGLVADDPTSLDATKDAFEVLRFIAEKRLQRGRLTVIDATNVQQRARRPLVALAREYHFIPVALVLNLPTRVCMERNEGRDDRDFGRHVVETQRRNLHRSLDNLHDEGFRIVRMLSSEEDVASAAIERRPMWSDHTDRPGPFDVIGDVHGCLTELEGLLQKLGYTENPYQGEALRHYDKTWKHPDGRTAVFVGDLVDRGPNSLKSLDLARNMFEAGHALVVPGNHEDKLRRFLRGNDVEVTHGLEETVAELENIPDKERETYEESTRHFIADLPSHVVLDGGDLVVAHAGLKESMHGGASEEVTDFALYGETTGATDEFGLPVRHDWARNYRGDATVVYGHTPVPRAEWLNNTMNIDTGAVYGEKLTAVRYPEREIVSQESADEYAEAIRPIEQNARGQSAQHAVDEVLNLDDFTGKFHVETELNPNITIRERQGASALEKLSRFAIHPKWLVHLPPTMSPTRTTQREGHLEAPAEAFKYYRDRGIDEVVCEEKHMGSRAIAIICRDEDTVRQRFGLRDEGIGVVYTRTGRRFLNDPAWEDGLLSRMHDVLSATDFWSTFDTDWVCVDAELMPWSLKAESLLQDQYAAVGAAASSSVDKAAELAKQASERGIDIDDIGSGLNDRQQMVDAYRSAYRRYCWTVEDLDDIELAPFHILATEGRTYFDKTHMWHMNTISEHFQTGDAPSTRRTRWRVVDPSDEVAVDDASEWWDELTSQGGEGMVVKPATFISEGKKGVVQPALKCRGREYLRIIYGPEYTTPENLDRLRNRGVGKKRSLAFREFALGVESLKRFVRNEALHRVHECVFGVMALESDPVDPTL
jgi:protein phosphatase